PPPCAPLFPYSTLFRSELLAHVVELAVEGREGPAEPLRSLGRARDLAAPRRILREDVLGERHDEQPLRARERDGADRRRARGPRDRKSTRLNSSHVKIS